MQGDKFLAQNLMHQDTEEFHVPLLRSMNEFCVSGSSRFVSCAFSVLTPENIKKSKECSATGSIPLSCATFVGSEISDTTIQ
jgi:hypothetical protein